MVVSIDAADHDIRDLVVRWSELLAEKRYEEALAMFTTGREEISWTPELLDEVIAGHGVIDGDAETLEGFSQISSAVKTVSSF